MKILIIGGTIFLGKYLTLAAISKGHKVTLFNRGASRSDEWPKVEHIKGDRDKDLDKLKGRQWDAVIDTCGYHPYSVGASAEILKDLVSH
ncbi:MAG: epimerase, partial [Proteobacteria bacterium]|nr:epimerase [Pseudomonadota bacterium]